jgi:hypothetical protein
MSWGPNSVIRSVSLSDSNLTDITQTTLNNCNGIAQDGKGNFYITYWNGNSLMGGQSIRQYNNSFTSYLDIINIGLSSPQDIMYNVYNDTLAVPNMNTNTVNFYSFPKPNTGICDEIVLRVLEPTIFFGASDSLSPNADSMLIFKIKNLSNYPIGVTKAKLHQTSALPPGMFFTNGVSSYVLADSDLGPGDSALFKWYFTVNLPLNTISNLKFKVSLTNLAPANSDVCFFKDTVTIDIPFSAASVELSNVPHILVSPNPASDFLNITLPEGKGLQNVHIFDMQGRLIRLLPNLPPGTNSTLALNELAPGIYSLKSNTGCLKFVKK